MKRWIAFVPVGVLMALGVLFVGSALRRDPHYEPAALVGQGLPDETLAPLDGGPAVRLKTVAPPGTLVNFFAYWCAPCQEEQPVLMALKAQGVRVIGVVSPWRYSAEATRAMLRRTGDPYSATLLDANGRAGLDFGVSGVPETFVVGPDGRIAAKVALPLTPASAEALLEHGAPAR
jgi:cytochrome c biogenesis protein CcmG/thiol:disulfide interchange protein DsbE